MRTAERVLAAIDTMIAVALPYADVQRNADKPVELSSDGLVIIRDGDPGEPEVYLSPLTYNFQHRVEIEVAARDFRDTSGHELLNQMLEAIGAAVESNRTLGGVALWLEPEAPVLAAVESFGSAPIHWADLTLVAHYITSNPLT